MGTVPTLAFHHYAVSARSGPNIQWGSGQRTHFLPEAVLPQTEYYQLGHLVRGNWLVVFINIYENMDCVLTLPIPNFLVDIIQGLDVMPSQTSSSKGELHTSLTHFLLGPKGLAPPSRSWGSTLTQLPTTGLSDSPEPCTLMLSQPREGRTQVASRQNQTWAWKLSRNTPQKALTCPASAPSVRGPRTAACRPSGSARAGRPLARPCQ